MASIEDSIVARWAEDGVAAGGGVTVTRAAVTGQRHSPTGIQVSGDAACVVTIESPASTILYTRRFTAAFGASETFEPGTIVGAVGAALLVKLSASTTNAEANMQGVTLL